MTNEEIGKRIGDALSSISMVLNNEDDDSLNEADRLILDNCLKKELGPIYEEYKQYDPENN